MDFVSRVSRWSGLGASRGPAILAALLVAVACTSEKANPPRPNIILISIDTLRADRLPVYGYGAVKTPAIDALAADSIVFENAYAHVPLTLPSHVSLLTGKLPPAHGVRNNLGYRFDAAVHPTIQSVLKNNGFTTAAAVSSYVLRGSTGISAGFDSYDDAMDNVEAATVDQLQRAGSRTSEAARSWLEQNGHKPFFLMLHLYEPHAPYEPPDPFRSQYAGREYDGEIAATDQILEAFIAYLKQRKFYDTTTIIFLADHGEGLGDHGEREHGVFLYRESIRVPLFLKLPQSQRHGTRVKTPVQLIDVFPTIAALTGIEVRRELDGRSLLAIAEGETPDRRVFSESMYPRIHLGLSELASLVDARHHYIDAPRPELYDLATDPAEKQNIAGLRRDVFAAMRREMSSLERVVTPPSAVSPEEQAKLAALGYLSRPVASAGTPADPKDHIADLESLSRTVSLNPEDAVASVKNVVARNPNFADAWAHLGKAYERIGRLEESIAAYRRVIEISPMLAGDAAVSIAESYLGLRKFDQSIEHARLALATHPAAAHAVLFKALLAKNDLAAAEREARWLIADQSRRVEGMVALAQIRVAQKRLEEAAALVANARQEIVQGARTVPMLSFMEGDVLARKGRIAEAEQAFFAEAEAFPRNREAYVRLAVLQALRGDVIASEKTFVRMVAASPDPSSYALAADTFDALGQGAAAARWRARTKQ